MRSPLAYYICLDEEFDGYDAEADYEFCQAIVAGRMGLHPDAWSSHDPLTTLPPHFPRKLPPLPDRWWEPPPQWEGPPVVIPVLLGPEPPGTWASPYPS